MAAPPPSPTGSFLLAAALALALLAAPHRAVAAAGQADAGPQSITVAMDDNYPPYVFRGQDGSLQGLLPDAWRLWSEKTGVPAAIVATDWGKAQEIMAQGKADVIDTLFFNEQRARLYDFTRPYATVDVPVFHSKTIGGITGVDALRGFTVAAKDGDASIAMLNSRGITSIRVYPSYEAIIQAAARGEIKVFTIDKPPALYYLAKHDLESQFHYGFTLYSGEFHRAVRKGDARMLALVERGFAAFTPAEREALEAKWLGQPLGNSRNWRLAAYALAAAASALLVLGGFNLALRRRVRAKTAELNSLLDELARSEERWQYALDGSRDGVWDWNIPAGKVYYSPRWKAQLGYDGDEIGESLDEWRQRVHPDDSRSALEHVWSHLEGRSPQIDMEHRLLAKDGAYRWILTRGKVVARGEDNAPLRCIGTHIDVTARKQAEEALRKALAFNAAILEHAPVGVQVFDFPSGECALANRLAARILGVEQDGPSPPRFTQIAAFASPSVREIVSWTMAGQGPLSLDIELPRKDAEAVTASCTFAMAGLDRQTFLLVISVDVSERVRMQRQLIHSEKMLSVGGLAAGMAHEINNPLASMLQSIQVVQRRLEGDVGANEQAAREAGFSLDQLRAYLLARDIPRLLGGARDAGTRASRIVANMLDFARQSGAGMVPEDLALLLDKALATCLDEKDQSGPCDFQGIEVLREYDPALPPVPCVASQIVQVAVNLLRNAAQALCGRQPGAPPPRIVVRTRREGGAACFEIEDNGPGLDDNQKRLAFDPFFSTKAPGHGTGLGLAVSYYIVVTNHQGYIGAQTASDRGALFVVRLPLARTAGSAP